MDQHRALPPLSLGPVATVRPAILSTPQAPSNTTIPSTSELAWAIADAVSANLCDVERLAIYVPLGSGDEGEALVRLLETVVRKQIRISHAIMRKIEQWLRGYRGSPEESRVRSLYASVRHLGG